MIQQRTDEWYQARLGKATASRFNDIMAGERYAGWRNYRAELVTERLVGKSYDNFTSAPMQWGIDNEPLARLLYTLKTNSKVEECGFYQHETLAAGASPDGIIDKDGRLEIKCPNSATHIETLRTGAVPKLYVAQVQGQMWISGGKWAHFVSFDPRLPENAKLIIINVPRDDAYIAKLETETARFLAQVDAEVEFVKNYGKEATDDKPI